MRKDWWPRRNDPVTLEKRAAFLATALAAMSRSEELIFAPIAPRSFPRWVCLMRDLDWRTTELENVRCDSGIASVSFALFAVARRHGRLG